ncbi:C4-dicarboxylate ABC transporter permease [Histophilus somni]|uniref:TRAP transporter small permease protein n=1 Tax=Histophilus somni TaxID=731 RepID=A0A9Q6Z0J1_HISSO|nr:TRAP transporter small permease [Histophilus somni]ARU64484.1 C4-dicarboxylate ABC transporter permease [Histophilus somni]ARU66269.1 C4-dicarboxylate ABC transporter permease [Histophilus somni]ARU68145.1 C4-dicarboxylate ABC transporter permease [Histophilus somni]ARU70024.1 C4-dicarboxylate ABC transporter permease [Histophilus somni]ARU71900.1 C4-dicarboxylate ABC transporter permease [Histophilus somni]
MKLDGYISSFRNTLTIILFSALVIVVSIGVFSRFLTSHPFAWTEELSRFIFIWLAWIASSLTIAKGINITFDIVLDKLEQTVGNIAHIIVNVISIIYILAVIILGYILCINNTNSYSPLLGVPMWTLNLAIPVGGVLMVYEQIKNLIKKR